MFGIFFWVFSEFFGRFQIFPDISGAFESSCDRMNNGFLVFNNQLAFGTLTHEFVIAVIEEKQIR